MSLNLLLYGLIFLREIFWIQIELAPTDWNPFNVNFELFEV